MGKIIVGIDVSEDRLDIAVRPSGEAFVVERNPRGLVELVARLRELSPDLIALEATGGYETVVAAALAGAACRLLSSTQRRSAPLPERWENAPRPIRSTPR